MTNIETNTASFDITRLATFLADVLEGDIPNTDILDVLDMLKPLVPGPVFEALALTFDMCPIHNQDLDSCADDDVLDVDTLPSMQPLNTPVLAACRHLRARTGE